MGKRVVCFCQFVDEKEIVDAIKHKGARTLKDIQILTGSSTRCGRCIPVVDRLLELEVVKIKPDAQLKLDL